MNLVRFDPFREIDRMQRDVSRLFDRLMPWDETQHESISFVPRAELSETEDAIHVKLEVPGIDAKDLDIQVSRNSVSISGQRQSETKTEANGVTRTEFHYGKFQRVIPLSVEVKNDAVQAEYKDGILTLNLPKSDTVKNKVVKVTVG